MNELRPPKTREEVRVDQTTQSILFYPRSSCVQTTPTRSSTTSKSYIRTSYYDVDRCSFFRVGKMSTYQMALHVVPYIGKFRFADLWYNLVRRINSPPDAAQRSMCAISFNLFTVTAFMRFETFTGYGLVLASGAVIIKKIKEKRKKFQTYSNSIFQSFHIPYRDSSVNKKTMSCGLKKLTLSDVFAELTV